MGALADGFRFTEATSTGVEELGMSEFVVAPACVEKGQNALARFGRDAVRRAITPKPARRREQWRSVRYKSRLVLLCIGSGICGFNSIGKRGEIGGAS